MRILPFLFFLFISPSVAYAAEALSGDSIQLDDGRIVKLQGIKAEDDAAKPTLQSLIDNHKLTLESNALDRYGRVITNVYAEKIWLQGELLKKGLAFVFPPTGSEPHLQDMFKPEQVARQAKRGLWSETIYADLAADQPDTITYGHYAFVRGKVVKAERIKNMMYLNFGEDWQKDFTIAIAAHDLRLWRKAGIDVENYTGKIIRVRGWVKRNFGPMVMVTHPAQIEIVP